MTRARLVVAALVALLLGGCGGNETETSRPETAVTVTASPGAGASTSSAASGDDQRFATALSLRGVCDNLAYTFRTGGQDPSEQWRYLATTLQSISDVSQPPAQRALEPMIDAASDGASAGKHADDEVYSDRFDAGYDQLDKTCVAMGSTGLDH